MDAMKGENISTFCDSGVANPKSQLSRRSATNPEGGGSLPFEPASNGNSISVGESPEGLNRPQKIARVPTIARRATDGFNMDGLSPSNRRPKHSQLRVGFTFIHTSGESFEAKALIDTGAEVSLVRQGLLPPSLFKISEIPLKIMGANEQRVRGGTL